MPGSRRKHDSYLHPGQVELVISAELEVFLYVLRHQFATVLRYLYDLYVHGEAEVTVNPSPDELTARQPRPGPCLATSPAGRPMSRPSRRLQRESDRPAAPIDTPAWHDALPSQLHLDAAVACSAGTGTQLMAASGGDMHIQPTDIALNGWPSCVSGRRAGNLCCRRLNSHLVFKPDI